MKPPKYVQISIRRFLFHKDVAQRNLLIIKEYVETNNIDRSLPLESLINPDIFKKKEKIAKGQMNIFEILESEN